jgi:hypothetical protein
LSTDGTAGATFRDDDSMHALAATRPMGISATALVLPNLRGGDTVIVT